MSNTFELLRPIYTPFGTRHSNAEGVIVNDYKVEFRRYATVPGETAEDALAIAKALGHPCPVIGGRV